MLFGIDWWWIVLAVVAYFGLGALWYSPVLFMKQWQAEMKHRAAEASMAASAMATTVAAIAILVLVEAYLVQATGVHGMQAGARLGLLLGLGFAATTALINRVFQNGSLRLYFIDQGYHVVGIVLAGAILGLQ